MNITRKIVKRNTHIILIHQVYFKLKWELDMWNKWESAGSLTVIASDSTINFIDHHTSASHSMKNFVDYRGLGQNLSVFLMNSFVLGWSVEFTLFSCNTNISDFQTFLWLFTLLILRLLRSDNCFYLFIFNSWSINTPDNMTHQPLATPPKETGLFGAMKIWFWRGAVWFHNFNSLLFSLESFKDASEQLWTMQWDVVLSRT